MEDGEMLKAGFGPALGRWDLESNPLLFLGRLTVLKRDASWRPKEDPVLEVWKESEKTLREVRAILLGSFNVCSCSNPGVLARILL